MKPLIPFLLAALLAAVACAALGEIAHAAAVSRPKGVNEAPEQVQVQYVVVFVKPGPTDAELREETVRRELASRRVED